MYRLTFFIVSSSLSVLDFAMVSTLSSISDVGSSGHGRRLSGGSRILCFGGLMGRGFGGGGGGVGGAGAGAARARAGAGDGAKKTDAILNISSENGVNFWIL